MDRSARIILLGAFIVLAVLRLVRYMKAGVAKRPVAAIPSSAGILAPTPVTAAATASPIAPEEKPTTRFLAAGAALLVWAAGNVLVWGCLFGLAVLDAVPVMLRLVAGIFANFYLLRLARAAANGLRARLGDATR